jgi:hypothetical protein
MIIEIKRIQGTGWHEILIDGQPGGNICYDEEREKRWGFKLDRRTRERTYKDIPALFDAIAAYNYDLIAHKLR